MYCTEPRHLRNSINLDRNTYDWFITLSKNESSIPELRQRKWIAGLFELEPVHVCWLELFMVKSEVLFATAISTVIDNHEGLQSLDSDLSCDCDL